MIFMLPKAVQIRSYIILAIFSVSVLASAVYLAPNHSYNKLAGWRSSDYGYQQEQEPSYWVNAAVNISSKFNGYSPAGIWVVGIEDGQNCELQFPGTEGNNITFVESDSAERYLEAFDNANVSIWLQVEPADADVLELIDIVLGRYSGHSCVVGFGVDIEWVNPDLFEDGRPITQSELNKWLERVKSYNEDYLLYLKHWDIEKMPNAYPQDIMFISDSQEFGSYEEMLDEFETWGRRFSDSSVGFQIGYDSDRSIWGDFDDPIGMVGRDISSRVPNCAGIYWVDFTIRGVFSP